ncbi:helix-turn-helix domain-containing protein [uncultured Roseobacter sp.]|uniref:IclR family transcriptional regulator n=1 Tax=uncultured Roseobacter sp. TaxID=114847 RepID=UPI00262D782E|nr:helix-turn-helix domain-containing protein [uncultured Roseobacter sp.]
MSASPSDRKFANTLARGLGVLQALAVSGEPLTHAGIARATGLPKPTVSRLTYTLCTLGYLSHPERNGPFYPGPAAVILGAASGLSVPFIPQVSGQMQRLAEETGTLCTIALAHDRQMVLTHTWQPAGGMVLRVRDGHRIPLLGTSSGQAWVAALSAAKFEALEPDPPLRAFRENGHMQLLRRGFTIATGADRASGQVNAVSVPYFVPAFGAPVVFSCGGPARVMTAAHLENETGPALRDVVQTLERQTGQPPALIAGSRQGRIGDDR